ncbi:MAG: helix-turn-helix transcriptional regulator [Cyanobacteria bacterium J06634_5]
MTIGLNRDIALDKTTRKKRSKEKKKKLKLSTIEELIATILSNQSNDLYGLQVIQAIDSVADEYSVSFGSLYPALQRLENKGIVKSYWGEDTPDNRGGARRRYYSLTEKGKDALNRIQGIRNQLSTVKVMS